MSKKTEPKDILAKPYRRELTPDEGGGYTATIQEFPGLVAHGEGATEAMKRLESAAADWIATALETGYPIREPQNFDDFSGKVALRLSRRLHQLAAEQANREGTSLNMLFSTAIAHYLGQQNALVDALEAVQSEIAKTFQVHRTYIVFPDHKGLQEVANTLTHRPASLVFDMNLVHGTSRVASNLDIAAESYGY